MNNTEVGFAWIGQASGTASDNTSENNLTGFVVQDDASPELTGNSWQSELNGGKHNVDDTGTGGSQGWSHHWRRDGPIPLAGRSGAPLPSRLSALATVDIRPITRGRA